MSSSKHMKTQSAKLKENLIIWEQILSLQEIKRVIKLKNALIQ